MICVLTEQHIGSLTSQHCGWNFWAFTHTTHAWWVLLLQWWDRGIERNACKHLDKASTIFEEITSSQFWATPNSSERAWVSGQHILDYTASILYYDFVQHKVLFIQNTWRSWICRVDHKAHCFVCKNVFHGAPCVVSHLPFVYRATEHVLNPLSILQCPYGVGSRLSLYAGQYALYSSLWF